MTGSAASDPSARPANQKALGTGSGIAWEDWVSWLDARDAATLGHTALAELTLARIREVGVSRSPEWWAQGVAVAYEQHIGRRAPGQSCDGTFAANASTTLPGSMDEAMACWRARVEGMTAFDGLALTGPPRVTSTEKWRYWRATFTDGSTLSVNVSAKPGGKAGLAVNHDRIGTAEARERWRGFWKGFIRTLGER